eukprot:10233432-Prorocentrum_lima.AAC.1
MTSSLVGSEMCIRDSSVTAAWGVTAEGGHHDGPAATGGRVCVCGGVAVSYTHLTLPTICSV